MSSDIIRIGSDVDARNVIAQVLADIARLRATVFLASQIRSEWLPMIKGVNFVRLPDAQIRGFLSGCGQYWIITALQRTQNIVKLRLEQKCGAAARDYTGSLEGNAWWVTLDGQGSGYWCPLPDCPCVCR